MIIHCAFCGHEWVGDDYRLSYTCPNCNEGSTRLTCEYKVICTTGAATASLMHVLNGFGAEGFRFVGMNGELVILMREVKSS